MAIDLKFVPILAWGVFTLGSLTWDFFTTFTLGSDAQTGLANTLGGSCLISGDGDCRIDFSSALPKSWEIDMITLLSFSPYCMDGKLIFVFCWRTAKISIKVC